MVGLLLLAACFDDFNLDDYCGSPQTDASSWEDASPIGDTAGDTRDTLVGTWTGDVPFEGETRALTFTLGSPAADPVTVSYPHAGEDAVGYQVADACGTTLRFTLPATVSMPDADLDVSFDLDIYTGGQIGDWYAQADVALPGCDGDACTLSVSLGIPRTGETTMDILLYLQDPETEGTAVAPFDEEDWGTITRE